MTKDRADAALIREMRSHGHPQITLVAFGSGAAALLPALATEAIRQAGESFAVNLGRLRTKLFKAALHGRS